MGGRGGRSGGSGCSPVDNFAFSERWEPEEDHIILTMTASDAGPIHWKSVVEKLPGRTVSSARSRWLRIRKGRQVIEDGQEPQKRCHVCGKSTRGRLLRGCSQISQADKKPELRKEEYGRREGRKEGYARIYTKEGRI